MKSTLKTSFAGRSIATVLFVLASMALWTACTEDSGALNPGDEAASSRKASPKSTQDIGEYQVTTTVTENGELWTYQIVREKPSAKNLSHIILDLENCGNLSATYNDINYATVNGAPAVFDNTEGQGTNCSPQSLTSNFVKIGLPAASSWTIVIKYDRGYEQATGANAWIKAGTTCSKTTLSAPGCPITNRCSFSQGYFFAKGSFKNGASDLWQNGLTVGGINYTQEEGTTFWDNNKGPGKDDVLRAFFQLGAVRLSGAESGIASDAALIDAYFSGINVVSAYNSTTKEWTFPTMNNDILEVDASLAAGRIGAFVDANHCSDVELCTVVNGNCEE